MTESSAKAGDELRQFMETRRVLKGCEFTHTQLGPRAGSFYISNEDSESFFNLYANAILDGADVHVTEKHRHISPICIDIDLRHPIGSERKYNDGHVDKIALEYARALGDLIGQDAMGGARFYVLEKTKGPRLDKKGKLMKDGFHLMVPGIVTRNAAQNIARIAAMERLSDTYADMESSNSIEDAFDEAVISRNNWFMYGSKKPDAGETAYELTRVLEVRLVVPSGLEVFQSPMVDDSSPKALSKILSLRNKFNESVVIAEHLPRILAIEDSSTRASKRESSERVILGSVLDSFSQDYVGDDIVRVREIAMLLSEHRCNDYESWMRVGWCLKNIDDSLLEVWTALSKRSEKYVDGECERVWIRMRRGTLGIGTLHMWAKTDSPEAYREMRSSSLHELILSSLTGTHYDIASVVYSMFRHRFVCSSIRSKQWYEFTNHRWMPSDSGTTLRKRLSTDVWREFSEAVNRFNQRALSSPGHNDQQDQQEKAKNILAVAQKLKVTLFKDYVMKECAEMFYEAKFEEKLDSNINIIGFENGVYDLDADEFRDGRPDDYLTFTTGNNYVPYDENSVAADGVQRYLAQVLTKPDMREYVMKLFASFLHGATKEQKFYIWTGSGSNSKSKLVELFELAFGDYCCKLPVTLLTQKRAASNAATSEVAQAKGKRFACMQEPSEDEKMNVGLMKELSGGDKIMARCIYKEPIEFKPQFKMILLCNHLPDVPSDDGGTWRRIRVAEFTSKFVERPNPLSNEIEFPIDLSLTSKMETWKESFMSLLIKVYKRYVDEGIVEPDEVMRCTNEYKKQNDHLAEFVETRIERDSSSFMLATDVYSEAKAFARDANIARFAVKNTFEKYIERTLNTKITCINGVKGFRGFKLKIVMDEGDDALSTTGVGEEEEEQQECMFV